MVPVTAADQDPPPSFDSARTRYLCRVKKKGTSLVRHASLKIETNCCHSRALLSNLHAHVGGGKTVTLYTLKFSLCRESQVLVCIASARVKVSPASFALAVGRVDTLQFHVAVYAHHRHQSSFEAASCRQ